MTASIFALKAFKNHGASTDSIQLITLATIIVCLLCVVESDRRTKMINPALNRLKRFGYNYSLKIPPLRQFLLMRQTLLCSKLNSLRCFYLNQQFPPPPPYFLMDRPHNFNLLDKD